VLGFYNPLTQHDSNRLEDGSKTMGDRDQKIIHRWNHESQKSTWTTESSNNVGKVLDHLKLGLDNETALNIPSIESIL
jgi:hypothetical protein